MLRRNFFSNLGFLGIGSSLKFSKVTPRNTSLTSVNYYLVQNGGLRSTNNLGIGLLIVNDPVYLQSEIFNIRRNCNYSTQFNYARTNAYKVVPSKKIIDLFKNTSGVSFHSKIIQNPYLILKGKSPKQILDIRMNWYHDLLNTAGISSGNVVVMVKSESAFGPSQIFYNALMNDPQLSIQLQTVRSFESDILQLASFLNGSVVSDNTSIISNTNKIELNNYFKSELNVSDLSVGTEVVNKINIF